MPLYQSPGFPAVKIQGNLAVSGSAANGGHRGDHGELITANQPQVSAKLPGCSQVIIGCRAGRLVGAQILLLDVADLGELRDADIAGNLGFGYQVETVEKPDLTGGYLELLGFYHVLCRSIGNGDLDFVPLVNAVLGMQGLGSQQSFPSTWSGSPIQ